ncbi:MAG: right-handed parallel beta-helix repeat-containing protein [candidate division SR1 bacterium]|nr:right-handed parallel beta-helix repeat-containing protein [candidate division SR1 bacterium]
MKAVHHIYKHLKHHHKKYLFGIFGSFAIAKMVMLFAGVIGLMDLANTFAVEPDDSIITQYYGSGSTYTSGRTSNICNTSGMTVYYIAPGTDILPQTLSGNSIYVLLAGAHITSRVIYLNTCSALVGSGDATFFSTGQFATMIYGYQKQNVIINNIKIDGSGDGLGGTHDKNSLGIGLQESSNTTIDNVSVYNILDYGIYLNSSSENILRNNDTYANSVGIILEFGSNNNTLDGNSSHNNTKGLHLGYSSDSNTIINSQFYNNSNGLVIYASLYNTIESSQFYNNINGIFEDGADSNTITGSQSYNNTNYGIFLQGASNNTINQTETYGNTISIALESSMHTTISNTQSYNNSADGIYLNSNSNNNFLQYVEVYNNAMNGIDLELSSINNTINNAQIYNNGSNGIYLYSDANVNTINNTQIYNNSYGIVMYASYSNTINNSDIYNNSSDGINFQNMSRDNNVYNTQIYNNFYGINNDPISFDNIYYGTLTMFANDQNVRDDNGGAGFYSGLDTQFPGMFGGGIIYTGGIMSCDWVTNPKNKYGIFLIDEVSDPTCNFRGAYYSRLGTSYNRYRYGGNILTENLALEATGAGLPAMLSWLDLPFGLPYIAEVRPLLNGFLVLAGGDPYTTDTGVWVDLAVSESADYVLTGDFEESPLIGSLIDSNSINVTFTPGYGTKNFTVSYTTGGQERIVSKSIEYVHNIYCDYLITDIPQVECDALFSLYTSTDGDNRHYNTKWFGNGDPTPTTACDWYGVSCGAGYVQNINLPGNNLSGTITSGFNNISNLTYIYLQDNQITHIETGAFSGFSSLYYFEMFNNYISGSSLELFCPFTTLYYLSVRDNYFVGDIPSCLTGLTSVNIGYNFLNTNVDNASDLFTYLNAHSNGWEAQYVPANLSFVSGIANSSGNNFWMNIRYRNYGPQNINSGVIYYDIQTGITLSADMTGYMTGVTDTGYIGFGDPCFDQFYTYGSGPYQNAFDDYALSNEYGNFYLMLQQILRYPGAATGAGQWFINYLRDHDQTITNWRTYFIGRFDSSLDIGTVPNCGAPGRNVYIFDVGTIMTGSTTSFTITGVSSDTLRDDGFINTFQSFSTNSLRRDSTTGNNWLVLGIDPPLLTKPGDPFPDIIITITTSPTTGGSGIPPLGPDHCLYVTGSNTNLSGANHAGIDYSPEYYDGTCEGHHELPIITGGCTLYTTELRRAYDFAYYFHITTIPDCVNVDMYGPLRRRDLAKMMVVFAENIFGRTGIMVDNPKCTTFGDLGTETTESKEYIKRACRYGFMGLEPEGTTPQDIFNPDQKVPRAQFGTVISRFLWRTAYGTKNGKLYYVKHLQALKLAGVMNDISQPFIYEVRGRVMLVMKRIYDSK